MSDFTLPGCGTFLLVLPCRSGSNPRLVFLFAVIVGAEFIPRTLSGSALLGAI